MTGKEFKLWRTSRDYSMQDVQNLTGVYKSRISRFEHGNAISLKNYQALEALMNNETPSTDDKQTQIRFHLKQLEILTKGED